jgi:ribosomal protein S27AE
VENERKKQKRAAARAVPRTGEPGAEEPAGAALAEAGEEPAPEEVVPEDLGKEEPEEGVPEGEEELEGEGQAPLAVTREVVGEAARDVQKARLELSQEVKFCPVCESLMKLRLSYWTCGDCGYQEAVPAAILPPPGAQREIDALEDFSTEGEGGQAEPGEGEGENGGADSDRVLFVREPARVPRVPVLMVNLQDANANRALYETPAKTVTLNCPYCGEEYQAPASKAKQRATCGKPKCQYAHQSEAKKQRKSGILSQPSPMDRVGPFGLSAAVPNRECRYCGRDFSPVDDYDRCCSPECEARLDLEFERSRQSVANRLGKDVALSAARYRREIYGDES